MKSSQPCIRRSQRVIRLVSELHCMGYQRLRIMPYEYPLAWRHCIAPCSAFSRHNGAFLPVSGPEFPTYSSARECAYFNWQDAVADNARTLAEKFVERFPGVTEQGQGRDWLYAGWLAKLVGRLEQADHLPYVVAEDLRINPYSLPGLPIRDYGGDHGLHMDFPLPPPGDLDDDPAEFSGECGPSGLQAAVRLASQPNYLGPPEVVSAIVRRLFEVVVDTHRGEARHEDQVKVIDEITNALTSDDSGYTRMPGWHTAGCLGQAIVRYFKMDPDWYADENLRCLVDEGMYAVVRQIDKLLDGFQNDPKAAWNPHGLAQLNAVHQFVVAVLLGTNVLTSPNKTIADFVWERAAG